MEELIDIHSHILMDVDDGAKNLEESIKMLKIAWKDNIRDIILTPHYLTRDRSAPFEIVNTKIDELQLELESLKIPIRLHRGNELYYSKDLVEDLETRRASTLPYGSNKVLVEFNPAASFQYLKNSFYQLLCNGYKPILAHTERYECLFEHNDYINKLKECGVSFQINSSSVMGKTGRRYKKRTRELLKNNLIDFIATDAHDGKKRSPQLRLCAKYIEKKFGRERYQKIFQENPKRLLLTK